MIEAIGFADWGLHALVWLPALGMIPVLAGPESSAKKVAFWWSTGIFVLSLGLWWAFEPGTAAMQLISQTPWIEAWGVHYALGVDGISLFMVLLTTLTTPIAILGSFNYIQKKERAFYALMLLLQTGVVGVFLATDLFLFYVFFELTLVPMYFIVGVWGGERRVYAAVKFFLYTAFGSLLMLVAIFYLYWRAQTLSGEPSFLIADLLRVPLSLQEQLWLFAAFALAFSIKVPVFPLHTWLPDAHVEAPTPGSVVLAAVLLKMGTYGFLRFLLPLFPAASQHPTVVSTMMILGVIGIIYAAWVAAVQPDAKKLVAYTSVAHMGFVVIGIFALNVNGLQGGLVVMVSHGVSTGALFLLLGMLYERRHTRRIEDFGGLGRVAPMLATAFVVTALASIGLPGTSGFVGEFLALLGAFESRPILTLIATTGVIFAAYYMLPMVQKIFFNRLETDENRAVQDLSGREIAVLSPLLVLMIVIGVFPTPILERMEPSVRAVLERVEAADRDLGLAELGVRADVAPAPALPPALPPANAPAIWAPPVAEAGAAHAASATSIEPPGYAPPSAAPPTAADATQATTDDED
ncbi:MAG: NADH-quinone oxidoreductase subunit M [Gemmatimonadetes bacterium]|nr:NADH-quinone oxidoreductase subunit M [Gemmatimonadota bacterium]